MLKNQMLVMLDEQKVKNCNKCSAICTSRTNTVFGEGNVQTRVMFVGEAPGQNEDEKGRPFVGAAGKLLDNMIAACGWRREDVYICNCLKCRPPGNRRPAQSELDNCRPYLDLQIKIVNPQYIVCLGATAAQHVLNRPMTGITNLRGTVHKLEGRKVICTYHPSYILQAADGKKDDIKRDVWYDLQLLMKDMRNENY